MLKVARGFIQLTDIMSPKKARTIGPYTLIRKLGCGGFGEVWLAERRGKLVTTKVALKLPYDKFADSAAIRNEASIWERASGHPNVLPIIEADVFNGQAAIVSEFAPDGSLQDKLKREEQLPLQNAMAVMVGVLDGLAFLHSKGIIHRDLKPANIMIQAGSPRLTDFGISKLVDTESGSQTTNISGTFAYMAPEAFDGRRSAQTDIWSAGVLLYQLVTGQLPFPQRDITSLIGAIMMSDWDRRPGEIPREIANVIFKALSKDPAGRFQTANAMRDALVVASGTGLSDFNDNETLTVIGSASKKQWILTKLRAFSLVPVVVVSVFAGIGLFWFGLAPPPPPPTNQPSPPPTNRPSPTPTIYIPGPRGGCYYINANGRKVYVSRSKCVP